MSRRKSICLQIFLLCLLLVFLTPIRLYLKERSKVSGFEATSNETDSFRRQEISLSLLEKIERECQKEGLDFSEGITLTMLHGDFEPDTVFLQDELYLKYKEEAYLSMLNSYQGIWEDVQCFPVLMEEGYYEDTWMAPRNYRGERTHEGTDIFGDVELAGYYPVVSMTDGIVEKVGWLPLGGYRIGIRSPSGGYYYYAHLDSYEKNFQEGEAVTAGQILGFMGDSGYGTEGTKGKFAVHLHLGIYIRTKHHKELSVNPYPVLKYTEKNIQNSKF